MNYRFFKVWLAFWCCLAVPKHALAGTEPALSATAIYEKFNLRSIRSSFGPLMKAICTSTIQETLSRDPADIPILEFQSDTLIAENSSRRVGIRVRELDGLKLFEFYEAITDATYRDFTVYEVEFDFSSGLWTAVAVRDIDSFEITESIERSNWIRMPQEDIFTKQACVD